MEDNNSVPNDPAQEETHSELQEQEEDSWLSLILDFPYIGEFLAAVLAVLPGIILVTVVALVLDTDSDVVFNWAILISLPLTYFWLRFLERKAGLALCLPLPIVNIRIKWTLLPVGLMLAYHLFTGQSW